MQETSAMVDTESLKSTSLLFPKNHDRNGESRNAIPKDFILKTKQTSHNVTSAVQPTNLRCSNQQICYTYGTTGRGSGCVVASLPYLGKSPLNPYLPMHPFHQTCPVVGTGMGYVQFHRFGLSHSPDLKCPW